MGTATAERPKDAAANKPEPTAEPVAEQKPKEPRPYVVLIELDNPAAGAEPKKVWAVVGTYTATGQKSAMQQAAAELDKRGAQPEKPTFVAVPARSWQPRSPKTETVTKTSWE